MERWDHNWAHSGQMIVVPFVVGYLDMIDLVADYKLAVAVVDHIDRLVVVDHIHCR